MQYKPAYSITPVMLGLVGDISEWIGRLLVISDKTFTPRLRRYNRIRSIHASLSIENNTLSLEQVTAVINGKRVLGLPREIQEVRNAFAAYERMDDWVPASLDDLLEAHGILMAGLTDDSGSLRRGGVGIFRGEQVVHMAPPAKRVPFLIGDLLNWLRKTNEHPLVAGCVFHYEFEFIHPFSDGNGRMGRLWQTLILRQWKPLMAYLPVETVICERQEEYYRMLERSDNQSDATPFIEFLLEALRSAMQEAVSSDQVTDQVTDQVILLLKSISGKELGSAELMYSLGLAHRPTFRKNYLNPALVSGWIERTEPNSPRSPTQRYRLTEKGRQILNRKK